MSIYSNVDLSTLSDAELHKRADLLKNEAARQGVLQLSVKV